MMINITCSVTLGFRLFHAHTAGRANSAALLKYAPRNFGYDNIFSQVLFLIYRSRVRLILIHAQSISAVSHFNGCSYYKGISFQTRFAESTYKNFKQALEFEMLLK